MNAAAIQPDTEPQRFMPLPLRLTPTASAVAKTRLTLAAIVLVLLGLSAIIPGIILDRIFHRDVVTYVGGALPPLALICAYLFLKMRFPASKPDHGPRQRIDIGAKQVICRASVDEDAAWSSLTQFRWVLPGAAGKGHGFKRADVPNPPAPGHVGDYHIEAAKLTDDGSTNEFGYYDRPEIQFDLAEYSHMPATRLRAEMVVDWLNDLRARADRGELADGAEIAVPS